jgi:outer membrane protein OmpA-like peptidoglycan-associated protein
MTLGLRAHPSRRFAVDLGADFGVQGPSFVYGSPLPAWSAFAGLSYTFAREAERSGDASARVAAPCTTASEPSTNARPVPENAADPSAAPGADPAPSPGSAPLPVDASPAADAAQVVASGDALVPVSLRVVDDGDDDLADASTTAVAVVEANAPERVVAKGARFALPPGDYVVHVEAAGHAPRERSLGLVAGSRVELELFVRKNPERPAVTVTANAIELGEPVRFGHRDATLRPDAAPVLDAIVAALAQHPEITRLAIEGHTDNRGGARPNLKLSRDRAEAVRRYLAAHGVDARRLSAEGFGESRPLEPNVTDRGRARNRRVELRIVR